MGLHRKLLLIILTGLVACSPGLASPGLTPQPSQVDPGPAILSGPDIPGEFRLSACPFVLPEETMPGEDVICGYLPVYEQPTRKPGQQGRVIRLAVAIFEPPGGATEPDPVIYLMGGPGGSMLKQLDVDLEAFARPVFASGRALVVFDQRGVGLSRPALDCPVYQESSLDLLDRQLEGRHITEQEIIEIFMADLDDCRSDLAQISDLSAYHSANSAADVQTLIQALGYEAVNLWGGSYGTRLALEVMRRNPDHLRSVVLEAVYPPDVDLYIEGPGNFRRSLERLFAACAENPACQQRYPELETVLFATVARLNAQPVVQEIYIPLLEQEYDVQLNGVTLLGIVFQLLYDSQMRYFIPRIIYEAYQEDYNYTNRVYAAMISLASLSSRGMQLSVQCHEELPFSSLPEYRKELARYPELASMYRNSIIGELVYQACDIWSAGVADPSANQPVESDIPALIYNGEFDPITPPEWGYHAAETLSHSYVYEFPGIGHGASLAHDCPLNMMVAFLENPSLPPEDACIEAMNQP